jgi:hypothetical protein
MTSVDEPHPELQIKPSVEPLNNWYFLPVCGDFSGSSVGFTLRSAARDG